MFDHRRLGAGQVRALLMLALLALTLAGVVYAVLRATTPPAPPEGRGMGTLRPDNPALSQSLTTDPEAIDAAKRYVVEGQFRNAIVILDRAVQRWPQSQQLRLRLAEARVHNEDFALAIEQLQEALRIGPKSADIHAQLAEVANSLHKRSEDRAHLQLALQHYEQAEQADGSRPEYPFFLAQVQLKANEPVKAQASLLRALRVDPNYHMAYGVLAQIAFRDGQTELAAQQVDKARAIAPEFLPWRTLKGKTLLRQNKPDEALLLLVGLPYDQRRQAEVRDTIVEAFAMNKQWLQAANELAQARAYEPGNVDLALREAQLWERAGDKEAAIGLARTAASLGSKAGAEMANRLAAELAGGPAPKP